jgi:hypothetical protein
LYRRIQGQVLFPPDEVSRRRRDGAAGVHSPLVTEIRSPPVITR